MLITHPYRSLLVIMLSAVITLTVHGQNDDVKLANEYYARGEIEKAKDLYATMAKDKAKIPLIHNNYYFLLLSTADFKLADKYISNLIKTNPSNILYRLDYGLIYKYQDKEAMADKYYKGLIDEIKSNQQLVRNAANYFSSKQLPRYAVYAFIESRKELKNDMLYSLDLANLYRMTNEIEFMVIEYLNFITVNPKNIRYVKNTMQMVLSEPGEYEILEAILMERIQKEPDNIIYPELLIWVNIQLKNFYGAFIQARALDKRTGKEGDNTLEIGVIALENNDYNNAGKIFDYVISNYKGTQNYIKARMYIIRAYEMKVKNTYPISEEEIRNVIGNYDKFINELGIDRNTLEALRNKALLHAFYLDERDTAISILLKIVNMPRANPTIRAQSKLDLGDIYLLNGEPWESTLLYSQVEREMKETPEGYEAKLKNAKLSYFKGDFQLAQEHLDILKEATTREISNDAISLSLLIKENVTLDSSETAMKKYAAIELMLFRNKTKEVLQMIEDMKKEFPYHSLTDELLWLEADIRIKTGEFDKGLNLLTEIYDNFGEDVLGDDAYFLMGELYERHLNNKEKAMEIYMDFLIKYPGSVYTAESRKRFRALRGDFKEEEIVN
ncbi:MAG: tetratricopeptide repeat protein [Cyclobacteriaceae bacterium]|nr:tetratricopeptide repeat protein [Cyclobacteriaceae bacterium]